MSYFPFPNSAPPTLDKTERMFYSTTQAAHRRTDACLGSAPVLPARLPAVTQGSMRGPIPKTVIAHRENQDALHPSRAKPYPRRSSRAQKRPCQHVRYRTPDNSRNSSSSGRYPGSPPSSYCNSIPSCTSQYPLRIEVSVRDLHSETPPPPNPAQ